MKESVGRPVSPLGGQTQLVRVHRGMGLWAAPQQAGGSGFSRVRKARPGVKSAPLRARTARMQRAWRRNHSRGLRRSPWTYLVPSPALTPPLGPRLHSEHRECVPTLGRTQPLPALTGSRARSQDTCLAPNNHTVTVLLLGERLLGRGPGCCESL